MITMTYSQAMGIKDRSPYFFIQTSVGCPSGFRPDLEWPSVTPDWDTMVKPYKNKTIDENIYCFRYLKQLYTNTKSIISEWGAIEDTCNVLKKEPVLLCYDKEFCHRFQLMGFLIGLTAGYETGIKIIATGE